MTDRVKGFMVTLDDDYRVDNIESLMTALHMVKHVIDVKPVITNPDDYMNRARIVREIRDAVYDFAATIGDV